MRRQKPLGKPIWRLPPEKPPMLEEPMESNWAVRGGGVEAKDKREEVIEERSRDEDKEDKEDKEERDEDTERSDGKGKGKGKEGEEEDTEEEQQTWKVSYQNVGRSIETTNILLEKARQEKRDLVFVAEALEGKKGERTIQAGYRIFSKPGLQLVLYISEEADLTALGHVQVSHTWISVGNLITGVYLSPSLNINPIREHLLDIPISDNIIGDFNCTHRYKRRALLEMATAHDLKEIPIAGKTWRRWNRPQSRWMESKPDTVFSVGNWAMENLDWTTSVHAIVSRNIPS